MHVKRELLPPRLNSWSFRHSSTLDLVESFNPQPNPFPLGHRHIQATAHPLRVGLLEALTSRRSVTTAQALKLLKDRDCRSGNGGLTLAQVSYHVRVLEREGLVEDLGPPGLKSGPPFEPTEKGVEVMAAIGLPRKNVD